MALSLSIGIGRVVGLSAIDRDDGAFEFSVRHSSGATANRIFFGAENVGAGLEFLFSSEPSQRARSFRITFGVAAARPARGVSRLRIVIPDECLFAVIGSLICAICQRSARQAQ